MKRSVLIIEDDPAAMLLLDGALSAEEWEVFQAETPEDAAYLMHEYQIDVIICDNHLPGMKGIVFAAVMKELDYKTPVILVTASIDSALVEDSMSAYVVDLLEKPITKERLQRALDRALQELTPEY